jgi:hypothetical protein
MDTCVVCGEPVDQTNSAECHGCGRRYHLVLKQGAQGKDCGNVWVDDLTTSLKFACRNCLNEAGADLPAAASETRPRLSPPSRARRSRGQRRYRKR